MSRGTGEGESCPDQSLPPLEAPVTGSSSGWRPLGWSLQWLEAPLTGGSIGWRPPWLEAPVSGGPLGWRHQWLEAPLAGGSSTWRPLGWKLQWLEAPVASSTTRMLTLQRCCGRVPRGRGRRLVNSPRTVRRKFLVMKQ